MKITAFRRFFTEDYKDVPKGNWFSSLLSNLNLFTDPVITALRNNLTIQDNFRADVKTVPCVSMVETQVGTSFTGSPSGMQVMFVDGAMLMGWELRPIKPGVVGVTVKLSDTISHNVTLAIFQ